LGSFPVFRASYRAIFPPAVSVAGRSARRAGRKGSAVPDPRPALPLSVSYGIHFRVADMAACGAGETRGLTFLPRLELPHGRQRVFADVAERGVFLELFW